MATNWGGARPGAGRPRKKESERTFEAHHARAPIARDVPLHVTFVVVKEIPALRGRALSAVVKGALAKQRELLADADAHYFQVVFFGIQDDRIDLIVEATDKRGLRRGITGLKIRIARAMNTLLGREGLFWRDRYHACELRTPAETRRAVGYVLRRGLPGSPLVTPRTTLLRRHGHAKPTATPSSPHLHDR